MSFSKTYVFKEYGTSEVFRDSSVFRAVALLAEDPGAQSFRGVLINACDSTISLKVGLLPRGNYFQITQFPTFVLSSRR